MAEGQPTSGELRRKTNKPAARPVSLTVEYRPRNDNRNGGAQVTLQPTVHGVGARSVLMRHRALEAR